MRVTLASLTFLAGSIIAPLLSLSQPAPLSKAESIQQESLKLLHPAVVMVLAPEPGVEDLPLAAFMHFQNGAKTVIVYVTNGETTPGDTLADSPMLLAGERKKEADKAAEVLGSEAWFLNMHDPGAVHSAAELARVWPADTLAARLSIAIRMYQPDVIMLGRDAKNLLPSGSARDSVTRSALLRAITIASTRRDTLRENVLEPWKPGLLVEQASAIEQPRDYARTSPLNKTSPAALALHAAVTYRTLRLTVEATQSQAHSYHVMDERGRSGRSIVPAEMLRRLPSVPSLLAGAAKAVRRAVSEDRNGALKASLSSVSSAIDSTDQLLTNRAMELDTRGRRIALTWKNGLEKVRCALLGVKADIEQSDSLLTARQVWFFRVKGISPAWGTKSTEIFFPLAMKERWVVLAESPNYHFPLAVPAEFKVLTPEQVDMSLPLGHFGLTQNKLRTDFPYFIMHKDADRTRNFVIRGEAKLWMGPRRSFEVQTPLVYARPGSPVVYVMQNFSRDPYMGSVTLRDTSGLSVTKAESFQRKDQVIVDTLFLPYVATPPAGDYSWSLELSNKGGRFGLTARSLAVTIDSTMQPGLMTATYGSPVERALNGLGIPWKSVAEGGMDGIGTIIIDRNALSGERCSDDIVARIKTWVEQGGHVLLLPQEGIGARRAASAFGVSFTEVLPIPANAAVKTEQSTLFNAPNVLKPSDWEGWVVRRALARADFSRDHQDMRVLARAGDVPLIATYSLGKGRMTVMTADILSQLTNLHEGAHRLLVNLIAPH